MFALVRTVVEFSLRADDRQVVRERSAFGRNTVSIGGTPRSTVARLARIFHEGLGMMASRFAKQLRLDRRTQ